MKTTQEYAKECTVLFIDDVDHVRDLVERMLKRLFKAVYIASNGKEGLTVYREQRPDLIITDINMPEMDGLEMVQAIRSEDIEQKVIILSAHNDHSFFEKAINLKVDGYLIKPIDMDMLMKAVDNSVRLTVQKRQLEEFTAQLEKRVQEEVEKNTAKDREMIRTLTSFMEASPNPVIAYDGKKVVFANNRMLELFGKSREDVVGTETNVETLFEDRQGFIRSLKECRPEIGEDRVSINKNKGIRMIFRVLKHEGHWLDNHLIKVYTFNDITLSEYQKLKIKHYSDRLEDYIKGVRRQSAKMLSASAQETDNPQTVTKPLSEPEKTVKASKAATRELDEMESHVLMRSHQGKEISSESYIKDIDSYVLEEIQELTELETEINDEILDFEEHKRVENLYRIAERLGRYASTISLLFEFEDLAYAVNSLSGLLSRIDHQCTDETMIRKVDLYLSNILMDLSNWRRTIFVDMNTKDIHYLDSSLFSAILQLEMVINPPEESGASDDDGDLELF